MKFQMQKEIRKLKDGQKRKEKKNEKIIKYRPMQSEYIYRNYLFLISVKAITVTHSNRINSEGTKHKKKKN